MEVGGMMDALSALHGRVSCPKLVDPAPAGDVLKNIQKAAFRAADHARMRPWRFLVIEGEARNQLGDLFVASAQYSDDELTVKQRERIVKKPLRAPMIIIVIASLRDNPKVPEIEQIISAGAAAQNMITAAYAQGVGAIWRTGSVAYDQIVMDGLGLSRSEKIVGFLYLGTVPVEGLEAPPLQVEDYFQGWPS
jgi:nitroreductase